MGTTDVIKIGNKFAGYEYQCFIIAEIGINHNGDIGIAKRLIDVARLSGCDAVKFQFRGIESLYSPEKLSEAKKSPFGSTYRDYVCGREFNSDERAELVYHAMNNGLLWGASYWGCMPDEGYPLPDFIKIPSARAILLNEMGQLADYGLPILLSTGGCTDEEVWKAASLLIHKGVDFAVLQCNATYPAKINELDLKYIQTLNRYVGFVTGYSGHELGIAMSLAARVLGASIIERHITIDRSMWGTDQSASLEPDGIRRLVRDIRHYESALGDGGKRVYPGELEKMKSLRGAK